MIEKHLASLGAALSGAGFTTILDAARTACAHAYSAWVEERLPCNILGIPQGALIAPVHQARSCGVAAVQGMQSLVDELVAADVVQVVGGEVRPGRWQLTSYHGILAARDTPLRGVDPEVYIGEDSLHFVDWVASAPPSATALDIGAGSGISSVALARKAERVTALDIDATCCRAVPLTAGLNQVADRIETIQADASAGLGLGRRFDVIAGNTPGVPIPRRVRYSPAGNGGPDGLQVSRAVLEQLPDLLASNGMAMLKFESAGDDAFPKAQRLLKDLVDQHGWSALFVQHSRIPIEVRAAISTRWAGPLNPQLPVATLLAEFDAHSADIGATQFYTCSVEVRARGNGQLTTLPVYRYAEWVVGQNAQPLLAGVHMAAERALAEAYLERIRTLPDGVWELDVRKYMFAPLARAADLMTAVQDSSTFGEGVRAAFAREFAEDPVHARCLYVLAAIVLDACRMVSAGTGAAR